MLNQCCQPFVEEGHAIHSYFPKREFAIAVPTVLLVLLVVIAATFIALTMIFTATSDSATSPQNRAQQKQSSNAVRTAKVE